MLFKWNEFFFLDLHSKFKENSPILKSAPTSCICFPYGLGVNSKLGWPKHLRMWAQDDVPQVLQAANFARSISHFG